MKQRAAGASVIVLGAALACSVLLSTATAATDDKAVPSAGVALSPDEVQALTTLGVVPDSVTPEQLEEAWRIKWGLPDIAVVPDRITAVTALIPAANGGLTFDPDSLTYTQWVVAGSAAGEELRAKVRNAFDLVAHGSRIGLAFAVTPTSLATGQKTIAELVTAATTDAAWPEGVPLTGDWIVEKARFVLLAGDRSNDREVAQYFESRWPELVEVSAAQSLKQDENRRADSPSNGWNGGQAMCDQVTGECAVAAFPDKARCTAGFEWRRADGTRWMTTAAHCVEGMPSTTYWRRYLEPRYTIGLNSAADSRVDSASDAGLIRQSAYDYNNWFWVGSRYSTEQREITASEPHPSLGEAIYFSGANSGGQQGIVATVGTGLCDGDPARAVSGLRTTGGDSGAPYAVANTATSQSGDYRAAGTHSCGPEYDVEGWRQFTQVQTYIDAFGGGPATN